MSNLESVKRDEHLRDRVMRLVEGQPANDYEFRQIQLAFQYYLECNPQIKPADLDSKTRDQIMFSWSDSDLSKSFRHLCAVEAFKTHPRLQGKIANVTLADVKYWGEHECLPDR